MDVGCLLLSGKHARSRPQHKIIILRALIAGALLQAPEHIRSHHQEMADIVIGKQKIQVEIRLPVGLIKILPAAVAFILVRIEKHRGDSPLFTLLHGTGHFIQSVRRQKIVMVQKPCVGPPDRLQRFIGIFRDSQILRKLQITNAYILLLLHNPSHRVRVSGVRNHQLPVGPGLLPHAAKKGPQEIGRRFIGRYNHGKKGRILPAFRFASLPQKHILPRRLIAVAFLLHFLPEPLRRSPGGGRYAVSSEISEGAPPSRLEPFYHPYLHTKAFADVSTTVLRKGACAVKGICKSRTARLERAGHAGPSAQTAQPAADAPFLIFISYSITAFSSSVSFSFFSCASARLVPFTPM